MKVLKILTTGLLYLWLTAQVMLGQNITQTIRGKVMDENTRQPLAGANIVITSLKKQKGTVSGKEGNFRLEEIPVGRQTLRVSFIGYHPVSLDNLNLTSGKELLLTIELEEKAFKTKEVVIKGEKDKADAQNEMATVSARVFSVEESERYAGSLNDVSRMAFNFAGVRGGNDAVNDIIIRGNAPIGLLWRLEGVDIPNPNHFGEFGSTGGPVSMLNTNLLSNSEFYTGAFPAEYGNAYSGAFDLQMRNGNNQKYEFLGQIGFNGAELGAEGPVSREKGSSFLINYRYNNLAVFHELGIELGTGTGVPVYQDVNFKLNFPGSRNGPLSIFGVGGLNRINILGSESESSDNQNFYAPESFDIQDQNRTGVLGLNKLWFLGNNTFLKLNLAGTHFKDGTKVDTVTDFEKDKTRDFYNQRFIRNKAFGSLILNHKFNARNLFKGGVYSSHYFFNLRDSFYRAFSDEYITLTNFEGDANLIQPFLSWKFKISKKLSLISGLHGMYFTLNDRFALEPRMGLEYKLNNINQFNFGYGYHSRLLPLEIYFNKVESATGETSYPNKDLDFIKSHHLVLGYDRFITNGVRLKTEVYYQYIPQAAVNDDPSPYSILNTGSFRFDDPLIMKNGGTGENYGLEITFEKFLEQGFYYLATVSLFNSRYTGSDSITRSSAYDGEYVLNLIAGKEFELGKKKEDRKNKTFLVVDGKVTWAGGQRYTPIDEQASRMAGSIVYKTGQAYEKQFPDYFRADIRIGLRVNSKKVSQEWALSIQNITGHTNYLYKRFNPATRKVETIRQLGFVPVGFWWIEF